MRQEETAACNLLERFFRANVDPDAVCGPGSDPPDLVCEAGGRRYAIEVTRANQQEKLGAQTTARMERDFPLLRMGERLEVATKAVRNRNCVLVLQGPPAGIKFRRWEREIKEAMHAFFESGKEGTLELEGASLTTFDAGDAWAMTVALRD